MWKKSALIYSDRLSMMLRGDSQEHHWGEDHVNVIRCSMLVFPHVFIHEIILANKLFNRSSEFTWRSLFRLSRPCEKVSGSSYLCFQHQSFFHSYCGEFASIGSISVLTWLLTELTTLLSDGRTLVNNVKNSGK